MTPLGPISSVPGGVAASAAGSVAAGAAERSGRIEAAGHSLAAGQQELSRHPLDSDTSASADRDADGWTGGHAGERERADPPAATGSDETASPSRPRLPDDPCGGALDVTA